MVKYNLSQRSREIIIRENICISQYVINTLEIVSPFYEEQIVLLVIVMSAKVKLLFLGCLLLYFAVSSAVFICFLNALALPLARNFWLRAFIHILVVPLSLYVYVWILMRFFPTPSRTHNLQDSEVDEDVDHTSESRK